MEELIDYLYDMHVSADIKIEELAEDIVNIVDMLIRHNDNITQ